MFVKRQPILASRPPTPSKQLELIYQLCGTPTDETEERLRRCDGWDKFQFPSVYPATLREKYLSTISSSGIDLLEKLLCLNPDQVSQSVISVVSHPSSSLSASQQRVLSIMNISSLMVGLSHHIVSRGSQSLWKIFTSTIFKRRKLKTSL
jgi:hypothetical protein